jgi:4-hydroxymandelate oxidase
MELSEYEREAAAVLPGAIFDYYAGGADDERTLRANETDWAEFWLRPHVLRDVTDVSLETTFLGSPAAMPIGVAPMAVQGNAHPEGEVAMAAGTAAAGGLLVVSTMASRPLEEVIAARPRGPRWFQLYLRSERSWGRGLAGRAEEAGYEALVLTVDVPVLGRRRREERGFALADGPLPPNLQHADDDADDPWATALPRYTTDASLTFADVEQLVRGSGLPVLVKGVLRGDDARRCVEAGAQGVIVSNHGGRQLDGAVSSARALREVVRAVGPDAEVYVDGGIRSGRDVLVGLALGARGAFIGRPALWALAVGGAEAVEDLLRGLRTELVRAMQLCGVTRLDDLTPDLLVSR